MCVNENTLVLELVVAKVCTFFEDNVHVGVFFIKDSLGWGMN